MWLLPRVFEQLLRNYIYTRGGMPDLLQLRNVPPIDFEYKEETWSNELVDIPSNDDIQGRFVEVKGPRDRLADRQTWWLRTMVESGVSAIVYYVVEDEKV